MKQDRVTLVIAWFLLASGVIHLFVWCISGQPWEGAVSLRKPALFGISGGLTVWSLGWVLSCLQSRVWERYVSPLMALALLVEVGLITMQYWRGVPSHFNDATRLDRQIEMTMLILILLATGWIGWLCWRVRHVQQPPAMAVAIRAGLLWLFLSCLIGIGTTVLGKWNLMQGRPYDLWGAAGVLKFPHGIALHAIQFLPAAAWALERWLPSRAEPIVRGLAWSQLFLVVFAISQTLQGRSRTDVDMWGAMCLVAAVVCVVFSLRRR